MLKVFSKSPITKICSCRTNAHRRLGFNVAEEDEHLKGSSNPVGWNRQGLPACEVGANML